MIGGFSKRSDAVDRCPQETANGRVCPRGEDAKVVNAQFESGTSQAMVGGVVLGVSAAAVVGGIVWHAVDRRGSASARARVVPVLARGAAGASYVVRF
jgi:hypothetical protein